MSQLLVPFCSPGSSLELMLLSLNDGHTLKLKGLTPFPVHHNLLQELRSMSSQWFAPWKKSYDNYSIFKSRDITLPTKIHLVKAMVFPVAMYRCESWTIKKAEHRRIDAFELWVLEKTLEFLPDSYSFFQSSCSKLFVLSLAFPLQHTLHL